LPGYYSPCKRRSRSKSQVHPNPLPTANAGTFIEFCREHREPRRPGYCELLPVRLHLLDEEANRDNFHHCGWARRFHAYVSEALRSPVALAFWGNRGVTPKVRYGGYSVQQLLSLVPEGVTLIAEMSAPTKAGQPDSYLLPTRDIVAPSDDSEIRQSLQALNPALPGLRRDGDEFQFGIHYGARVEFEYEVTSATPRPSHRP
jgi:hypothetical protein